jgi:hypothetical protein
MPVHVERPFDELGAYIKVIVRLSYYFCHKNTPFWETVLQSLKPTYGKKNYRIGSRITKYGSPSLKMSSLDYIARLQNHRQISTRTKCKLS